MIFVITSPLEQFQIIPIIPMYLGNLNFSITNSSLIVFVGITFFTIFLQATMYKKTCFSFVPKRWQNLIEFLYEMIAGLLIKDIVGLIGERYFPFVLSTFFFILISNLIGLVPYSFTATSHLIFTFSLAFLIFLAINIRFHI